MTAIAAQKPFEIFVEDRMVMRVHAQTPEDALNKWTDMEGAPNLVGAAQLYHVEVGALSAKPGKLTAKEVALRLRASDRHLKPV